MKRIFLAFLFGTFLSGCAVIDFLDGKHLDHTHDDGRPQYGGGYTGSRSSGHSH